jgi:hypothetical protein
MTSLPIRFAILTYPRCGSTYLATLLNSHSQILCHGELFYQHAIYYAVGYRDGSLNLASVEERDQYPDEFLSRVWAHPFGNRAVGFKLVAGQHTGAFRHILTDPEVRKIVLRRRNRLKKFVSARIADVEQNWTHYKYRFRPEDLKPIQVEVRLQELQAYLSKEQEFYSRVSTELQRAEGRHLAVDYEDFFGDQTTLFEVLRFLDVEPNTVGLEPATLKRNSRNLRDIITNFDDLSRALRGTEYERELYDTGF